MRKAGWVPVLSIVLVIVMAALTGCAAPGMTKEQVNRRHRNAIENDLLMMQDDFDAVFMIDRPSRSSRMMVR